MKTGKSTVLIVEDYMPVLEGIADYFEGEGYNVLTASDPKTALNKALDGKPDVIVLDLGLPNPEIGRELCIRLANLKAKPPIIVLSQHRKNLETSLKSEGAIDFVEKPFKVSELAARVQAQIMRQQKLGQSPIIIGEITYHPQEDRLDFATAKESSLHRRKRRFLKNS